MKFGSAVILAGGKSKRMGFDKQLLSIDGKRIIYSTIEKLKEEFNEVFVISSKPYFYDKIEVYSDEIKNQGPLAGIYTGLKKARSEYVYFTACDMPFVDTKWVNKLKDEIDNNSCKICCGIEEGKIEVFNAFYSKELIPTIEKILREDKKSVVEFIEDNSKTYLEIDKDYEYQFLKLNTKQAFVEYANNQRRKKRRSDLDKKYKNYLLLNYNEMNRI